MVTHHDQYLLIMCACVLFLDDIADASICRDLGRLACLRAEELEEESRRRARSTTPHRQRWWERTGRHLGPAQFSVLFRMRKPTFSLLVRKLYGTTGMCRRRSRGPDFDPCERVGIFLFRLGGGGGVTRAALQFQLSEGYVSDSTLEVAGLISERLYRKYIRWPSPREQREMSEQWELENSLRNVTGAIGGSHIKIPPPAEAQEVAHTNYMSFYSIVLLGVVDKRGMFRWCCSGTPGSCGDSIIFRGTTLYGLLEKEQGKPVEEGRRLLAADGACILGDAAFAEGPWMRTPIPRPSTRAEEFFNFKHSAMRSSVENTFGRLKTRFASLRKGLDCELQDCALLVNACVVLHNFVSKEEEEEEEVEPPGEVPVDDAPTRNGAGRRLGERVGSEHPARAGEVANLARAGFLRREWGAPGSRKDLARQGRFR